MCAKLVSIVIPVVNVTAIYWSAHLSYYFIILCVFLLNFIVQNLPPQFGQEIPKEQQRKLMICGLFWSKSLTMLNLVLKLSVDRFY